MAWQGWLMMLFVGVALWAEPTSAHEAEAPHQGHHLHSGHEQSGTPQWEGSPEGKAYSEFNHHLAGLLVILIAVSEWPAPILRRLVVTRFLLPASFLAAGVFLLIWSDHDSWPVGPKPFMRTFLTGDWETVQHKWFGLISLTVGAVESLRRVGRLPSGWAHYLLPAFAFVGGLSLFLHDHGIHPSAHQIARHHAIMGGMALTAGTAKVVSMVHASSRWEMLWSLFVLLIGVQLLIYTE